MVKRAVAAGTRTVIEAKAKIESAKRIAELTAMIDDSVIKDIKAQIVKVEKEHDDATTTHQWVVCMKMPWITSTPFGNRWWHIVTTIDNNIDEGFMKSPVNERKNSYDYESDKMANFSAVHYTQTSIYVNRWRDLSSVSSAKCSQKTCAEALTLRQYISYEYGLKL